MKTKLIDDLELFKTMLFFKSITPDDDGGLDFIEKYLSDFKCIKIDKEGVKNRFFYKDFGGNGTHLCFGGHIDVVPSGDGWISDPFIPHINGDEIRARGTQDMKSGLCAFIQAVNSADNFNGILSLLITSDEEGDAIYGTIEMLRHLKEINFLPDCAIIAEPTCDMVFGDIIKTGRRGSINGLIKLEGKQGHAAYPLKTINPIHQISTILDKIAGINLDNGDENFAPSQLILTDIRSGMQVTNVTPNNLELMFNVRNSTKTTKENIELFVSNIFKDLKYSLEIKQTAKPFATDKSSKIVQALEKTVKKHTKVTPALSTAGGTSDARFFGEFNIPTAEFGVVNDKIHGLNESTSIKDYLSLVSIFKDVIKEMQKG